MAVEQNDVLFGQIGIQKGLFNRAQFDQSRHIQMLLAKAAIQRSIADILIDLGIIKNQHARFILETLQQQLQLAERPRLSSVKIHPDLARYFQVYLQANQMLTAEQLKRCQQLLGIFQKVGLHKNLAEILMEEGVVSKAVLDQVVQGFKQSKAPEELQVPLPKSSEKSHQSAQAQNHPAAQTQNHPAAQTQNHPAVQTQNHPAVQTQNQGKKYFGNYEVLEKIGQGGMGAVYKVRPQGGDQLLALKVIKIHGRVPTHLIQRFELEAKSVARLSHPNILKVFDYGVIGHHHYYTMQYVSGHSLRKQMMAQWPSLPESLAIIRDIASALDHAHSRNICHRDVKPENILLDESGHVYLTDFGLAKDYSPDACALTGVGIIVGTPNYMAPEQADSRKYGPVGPRTDLYALGVIFYELLTGRVPFKADTKHQNAFVDIAIKLLNEPIPPILELNPHVPSEVVAICMQCLEKEQERRQESCAQLCQQIDRYLRSHHQQAKPVQVSTRRKKVQERVGSFYELRKIDDLFALGKLYHAKQRGLEREVMLRLVTPRTFVDDPPGAYENYQQMINTLARLNHPCLPDIYETGHCEGSFYCASYRLRGEPLINMAAKFQFSIYQKIDFFIALVDLLGLLHQQGVVHGNIQPDYIVYDGGSPKLTNFGSKVRSFGYIAPEQAREESYDGRADLFSVGIVMGEFFTNQKFFPPAERTEEMRVKFRNFGCRKLLQYLGAWREWQQLVRANWRNFSCLRWALAEKLKIARILNRCLQGKLEARYQTAQELSQDLQDYKILVIRKEIEQLSTATREAAKIPLNPTVNWHLLALALIIIALMLLGGILIF